MKKRLVAFLLVLIMVLGMLPVSAFAVDGDATKYTYTLYYKWNNGTDSTWSTEVTDRPTAATTFTFYVNGAKLTRDGYTFLGWADTADATTASYKGGDPIVLDKDNPTKTIYAVWEKNAAPIEYTVTYYKNDGSADDFFYKAVWEGPAEKFNIYWEKPTRDGYDFVGWAKTKDATEAQYAYGGAGGKQSWIKLDGPKVLYAVWQEAGLGPEAPRSPSDCKDQLKTNTIKLVCVGGNHPDKVITFADVSYGSDWSMGDTCKLNFYAKDAALKYPGHAPKNPEERIYVTFKWVNDKTDANGKYLPGEWVMDETTAAVVKLVDTGVEAPSKPTTAQLGNIKVTCRTNAEHSSEFPVAKCMGTTVGTVTFDSVKKQWYIDTAPMTTQLASRYDSWKGYAEGTHRLVNPDAELNARFYYDGEKWYTEDTLAIDICCGETPVKPTALDGSFAIVCKNNKATHPHKADYIATPSQYTISDVQMDDQGYYVTATVTVAPNLAAYNTATRVEHRLVNEQDATLTITFRYDPKATGKWTQQGKQQGELPVVEVICKVIEAPTRDDIFKALNGLVTVTCINRFWKDGNKNMDCGQGQYAAKAGIAGQDYTLVKGEDDTTWVVTFPVTNFVKSFKQNPAHHLYTGDTLSWYIRWEDNTWTSAPVEPGVDDLVKLTHAPTDWREVAKIATGGKSDCIHTLCVNSGLNVCDYGITVPFVNFKEDVVSVVPEAGVPGSYIATFRVDKFVDARAKVCNDKNFADAPRTHKLLTQETVQWRLYATPEADEKIGNNVPNHVWEAEPVKAGKDDVCTIAHNWVVTFNPDNGEPAFKQNVEYEGKATEPAAPEKTGYTFDGWYLDEAEAPFSFDTTITSDITLTAKWHVTPHNIYAYARLNSYFAPLTTDEFDTPVTLNEATLSRLGLGSYNSLGYISIGSFDFDAMPLTEDLYFDDDAELSAVAEKLATDIALETGVSDKIAEKIAWTALYKTVNEEDMEPGYPAEAGYQLSGNLNLASVTFRAGAENVENMPAVNYTYDDGAIDFYDFYFAGDTITLPTTEPTREGYSFEGWSVEVIPAENDADCYDADGEDDAADETLLKAGDTYTITKGGVIFTAQWKLNTYIIASTLRINGNEAVKETGKTYSWSHRYGGDFGVTIDYTDMFKALKDKTLEVDADNEPYDAEIELRFPGDKNRDGKLFNETILTYGQAGGGWNPGVKNTAYIWGYATTSYEVIFNSDGGSAVDTQIVKYGEKAVKPEDPTMKGYNFLGWYDKDGNPFDFDTEITHKTELKAQWEKKDYIIASDLRVNGDTANLADGKDYPWTHRYGGKYEETIDYQPMFDALKARALEADKANEPNPTKVDVELRFPGSKDRLFNEEIQTYGQDGGGWNPGVKNTAYIWGYAWTYYDVTFVTPEGATTVDAQLIKNGDCAAKPADPTKEGWKFLGWYADAAFETEFNFDAPITKKTSVYAKFELTSTPIGDIYVRYDVLHIKQLPDGTYDLANAEVEHLSAKKDTTVTAVAKNYSATHHFFNSKLGTLTGTAIQPYKGVDGKPVYTILTVYYDLDFHTLTFDTMGGSKIAPETVRHGLTVAKPKDPVNGGYIFDGWYTDKTFRTPYNFATPLTEDITIYAKWFLIVLPGVTVKKNTPKLNTADHFAYVQGYPDGTVKPAGNITRAETAAILFRLMDDASRETYYSTKSGFRDVASGSWYNTYVATLNNAGVITDSSNGYFRPNEAITRAELAAMLAKFSETTGAANYFNDVSASYWAANAIAICAKLGWITGYPDGTFRPDRNVTRAELMAMINRATGRAPKSADAFLPGMKTWIDNTADKWYYLDVQEATNSHSYTVKGSETWTALTSDPNWSLYE